MSGIFDRHIERGRLKKQRPNYKQIAYQLKRASRDVETAKGLIETDPEWAAAVAYHGMLRAGRALLFSHGYLPADGAQHKTVVELVGAIIGKEYEILFGQFERLRRKRNLFFYDAFESASVSDAKNSIESAAAMLKVIGDSIEESSPQQKLGF